MDIEYVGRVGQAKTPGPQLSCEEEDWRKENQLCFNCGKLGHMSRNCPAPKNVKPMRAGESNPQRQTSFPKKPEQKQRFNPTQMRQHIRALIDENFEEGSEEYNDLINEVEEKGF